MQQAQSRYGWLAADDAEEERQRSLGDIACAASAVVVVAHIKANKKTFLACSLMSTTSTGARGRNRMVVGGRCHMWKF